MTNNLRFLNLTFSFCAPEKRVAKNPRNIRWEKVSCLVLDPIRRGESGGHGKRRGGEESTLAYYCQGSLVEAGEREKVVGILPVHKIPDAKTLMGPK